MPDDIHVHYMKMALSLACKGIGNVSPNPMVGAVLVKRDKILSSGFHAHYGQSHAEVRAIEAAKESVKGATLYCTLEPCVHSDKQTPPCAQRLVCEGIGKVVIASIDPNPKVKGKGIALLRQSGIEVVYGVLAAENEELNRFYFKYMSRNLPYVTLKIAQTIDGKIAAQKGSQTWITSVRSRQLVHRLRAEYDSVLVGSNTIRIDNPVLTVHKKNGRNPIRIIIDGKLKLNPTYNVFQNTGRARTVLMAAVAKSNKTRIDIFKNQGCQVMQLAASPAGWIPMKTILKKLAAEKITSVLVEGGQHIFSQFIRHDLVDELKVFIAPQIWGHGVPSIVIEPLYKIRQWHLHAQQNIMGDLLLEYRR